MKYNYEVSVNDNKAKLNKDIFLFRGNRNIHYYFSIKGARFTFSKKENEDLIESSNATYAAITVVKPNGVEVANTIAPVENGLIHLKVTEDLIDEEIEIGDFDLIFDLFDDNEGAVTIPKVQRQFHVLERPCTTPISELVPTNTTNEVDLAMADYAITTYAEPVASTNEDGTFNKKTWAKGDKITTGELNRMEEGIYNNNTQLGDIANKTIIENNKLYLVKADGTKIDEGTILPTAGGGTNIDSIKMSVPKIVGTVFEKPKDRKYVAWALGNSEYDSSEDTINVLVNSCDTHGGNNCDCDLYLLKMNAKTLDYELIPIVVNYVVVNQNNTDVTFPTTSSHGAYTYGFCIDKDGNYLFIPNYQTIPYLFKSSDKGKTWNVSNPTMDTTDTCFTGLMQTSTGRYIVSTHSSRFLYSDDGVNWIKCSVPTSHVNGHEATIVELKENELIAVMRKRWTPTDNGAWNGNRQIDPAYICYSHDNGTTWTEGVESTTITEMSGSGCAIAVHKDEGVVELYATSRYPHGDKYGVVIQHYATIDDAMNDNWSTGKIIAYSQAKTYDDFGYPSCAVDSMGNTHLFYYDGDSDVSDSTNYYYIQCIRNVDNFPLNCDKHINSSLFLPYSAKEIDKKIKNLTAKINEIIINSGGTVEDPDFYVTDGLVASWDLYNKDTWDDTTNYCFSDSKNSLKLKSIDSPSNTSQTQVTTLNNVSYPMGNLAHGYFYCSDDLQEKFNNTSIFTIEANMFSSATPANYGMIAIPTNNLGKRYLELTPTMLNCSYNNSGTMKNKSVWIRDYYLDDNKTITFVNNNLNSYVITCDGTNINILYNGVLYSTIPIAQLGELYTSDFFKYGILLDYLDESSVRIYNKVLTNEECLQNYKFEKNRLGL